MAETKQSLTPGTETKPVPITLIPWPKVVFFYPLCLICLVCAGLQATIDVDHCFLGTIFIAAFLVNMMIITFDFPGVKALALALGIIAVGLLLVLLNVKFQIWAPLKDFLKGMCSYFYASTGFYLAISGIIFIMMIGGYALNRWWNCWTVEPNRLIHHRGPLGDAHEYPAIDIQVEKEIQDVFEFVLLGSGSLTFRVPNLEEPIRLDNILFIKGKEKKIQEMLRRLRVTTH